jgi:hypothetical protein
VYWEVTGHTWAGDIAAVPQTSAFTMDIIDCAARQIMSGRIA